jgi:hypothetical protein
MADPVIGELFPDPTAPYPRFTQPGGPGSPCVPTQPPQPYENIEGLAPAVVPIPYNEQAARFHADCGHSFQSYEVKRCAVGGVPSAVLCCPICSFVVNIYTPYSLLDEQQVIQG